MENENTTILKILMFPWLAHGHIFPFLELAKGILKRKNFHIYLCTTSINFSSINNFIEKNILQDSIELVQLHLEPNPELPPHYHTTKNVPPSLLFTLLQAFETSKSSFSNILNTIKPDLVLYDMFQPWAARISSSQGIPAVYFFVIGAATASYVHHHYVSWDDEFPFPELSLKDHEKKSIDDMVEFISGNIYEGDKDISFLNFRLSCEFVLLKTSKALEGKYLDYLSSKRQQKMVVVGPLVSDIANKIDEENLEIMEWLSKKDEYSTVYISFGSETFLSKQEIREVAKGLELCDGHVNFIWVIRFPVGEKPTNIGDVLPEGFLERVKERGMVVDGWAPQAHILAYKSTGAYMSHIGWGSIHESLYFGVPIIGMSMKLNNILDSKMLVDAGVCVEVARDENNVYWGEEIAKAINKVIVEKRSGEGLRRRAQELSEKMKMEEDPALDEAAEKLWQLCSKNKKPK